MRLSAFEVRFLQRLALEPKGGRVREGELMMAVRCGRNAMYAALWRAGDRLKAEGAVELQEQGCLRAWAITPLGLRALDSRRRRAKLRAAREA